MHADELPVDEAVAGRLIAAQFPALAGLPVHRVPSDATVNAIFRVGDAVAARFPLRAGDPVVVEAQLRRESAAMTELAAAIPVATPRRVGIGAPGPGYPLPWALQTWLPGAVADPVASAASIALADDVATLVAALRATPTRGRRFTGTGRGGELRDHDAWMAECLRRSAGLLDVAALGRLWAWLRELPRAGADVMSHGDLHPANLLLADGDPAGGMGEVRLAGVLDAGSFGPADRALDLIAAWHLFDAARRERIRDALGADDVEWARGAAWALQQSMGLVWYYQDSNPGMSALGRSTLGRLLADPGIARYSSSDPV